MKKILVLFCSILMILSFTSCSAVTDLVDSMPFFEDNTTINEAVNDSQEIMRALILANEDLKTGNSAGIYGDAALTKNVSFQDVIDKNNLKSQAETKRYNKVAYHLYWDYSLHAPFWSTDGEDDILNADGNSNVSHKDALRIQSTTPATDLT